LPQESNERWLQYVKERSLDELLAPVSYLDTSGIRRRLPRGPLLNHVVLNHSAYTRAHWPACT
jgi:hypothetical protein